QAYCGSNEFACCTGANPVFGNIGGAPCFPQGTTCSTVRLCPFDGNYHWCNNAGETPICGNNTFGCCDSAHPPFCDLAGANGGCWGCQTAGYKFNCQTLTCAP